MKSRRFARTALSTCAAVGLVAGMTTTAQADVLMDVPNPGFEVCSDADGYGGWNPFSRPEFVKTSTEVVYEGERSLHIHDTSTERGGGLLSDPTPIPTGEWADAGVVETAPPEAVTATILLYAAVKSTSSLHYDNVILTMIEEEPIDPRTASCPPRPPAGSWSAAPPTSGAPSTGPRR